MPQPPKKTLLTPKRVMQVSDSLQKRATLERQTADLMGSSMIAANKAGKKTDYMGRSNKENSEAITRHINKANVLDNNAKRYKALALKAMSNKNKKK